MESVVEQAPPENSAARALGGQYLTFLLADEEYGVEVLKVREIIGMLDITAVPQTPAFVMGVINLRGKVIPVIDLRRKFGLPDATYNQETCIIVVDVGTLMGIIVDTVREVHDISDANIVAPPKMGATVDTAFILGMGKVRDEVKLLLNIDVVLTNEALVAWDPDAERQGENAALRGGHRVIA